MVSILEFYFFGLTYYILFNMQINKFHLILLAVIYSLYRRSYWVGKRYFGLNVTPKKDMANMVSIEVIFTQIAIIFASYVGALLLNHFSNKYILIISLGLFIVGTFPLMFIKEDNHKDKININRKVFKLIPKKNILAMVLYESLFITSFIFPIYLYLYANNNFEYIGIFNIFVGISSMIFIYYFSKKMDNDKYDYLLASGLLLVLALLLKLNCNIIYLVLLIGLLEGIFSKAFAVGYTRNVYFLGTHFDSISYNMLYEVIQNLSRLVVFTIIFVITQDLKYILYLAIIGILVTSLIRFDDGKGGYN